ncbi:MAG: SMI1/KNR4 family protein [Flavobacteriales bacterium]|nr:SMI1/KNR4 family protein [Flavobacteriales bacterium]
MKTGYQLFQERNSGLKEAIQDVEKTLGFSFPPIYIRFLEKYEVGMDKMKLDTVVREDGITDIVGPVYYDGELSRNLIIQDFYDLEEVQQNWTNIDQYEETGDAKLLGIASLGSDPNGGLYVGIGDHNQDEIWRVNWETDPIFEKVSSSIEDFVQNLVQIEQ